MTASLSTCMTSVLSWAVQIENLWHYLKCHFWLNSVYADYDELEHDSKPSTTRI